MIQKTSTTDPPLWTILTNRMRHERAQWAGRHVTFDLRDSYTVTAYSSVEAIGAVAYTWWAALSYDLVAQT